MPDPNLDSTKPWAAWRELATFAVAMVVILGFLAYAFIFTIRGNLPPGQVEFIIGVLVGNFTAAVSYYVGSSVGSAAKSAAKKQEGG